MKSDQALIITKSKSVTQQMSKSLKFVYDKNAGDAIDSSDDNSVTEVNYDKGLQSAIRYDEDKDGEKVSQFKSENEVNSLKNVQ